jgi:hypothetical protein
MVSSPRRLQQQASLGVTIHGTTLFSSAAPR